MYLNFNISHTEALEYLSRQAGYSNWIHCQRELNNKLVEEVKPAIIPEQITFTEWLTKHKKRDSPLGDTASDMLRDAQCPAHYSAREQFLGYLEFKCARFEVIRILKEAWNNYLLYLKRKANPDLIKKPAAKKVQEQTDTRRVVYVKNVIPIHYSKRKAEKFIVGDKAWISWDGSKAHPVTIFEVDERHYTFRIERPLKDSKGTRFLFLDEVRSTAELACLNRVTS
jgi:hypothetical protein